MSCFGVGELMLSRVFSLTGFLVARRTMLRLSSGGGISSCSRKSSPMSSSFWIVARQVKMEGMPPKAPKRSSQLVALRLRLGRPGLEITRSPKPLSRNWST